MYKFTCVSSRKQDRDRGTAGACVMIKWKAVLEKNEVQTMDMCFILVVLPWLHPENILYDWAERKTTEAGVWPLTFDSNDRSDVLVVAGKRMSNFPGTMFPEKMFINGAAFLDKPVILVDSMELPVFLLFCKSGSAITLPSPLVVMPVNHVLCMLTMHVQKFAFDPQGNQAQLSCLLPRFLYSRETGAHILTTGMSHSLHLKFSTLVGLCIFGSVHFKCIFCWCVVMACAWKPRISMSPSVPTAPWRSQLVLWVWGRDGVFNSTANWLLDPCL